MKKVRCTGCGKLKYRAEFSPHSRKLNGLQSQCKPCRRVWSARDRERRPEHYRKIHRLAYRRHAMYSMLKRARARAAKSGAKYSLDDTDRKRLQCTLDQGFCQLTGLPFHTGDGYRFNSPSLDRIDPAKGYERGNVRIILAALNAAFGNWGERVLLEMMQSYLIKKRRGK